MRLREIMDMRCREQPEKWDDSGRDTKGCSSERHIYFWNLIKKLIHSSGNFYKSGSGEQPFVKRKWNRASLTVEASLALPVSDRGSCVIKNRGSLPAAWNADGISAGVRAVSFRLCLRGG